MIDDEERARRERAKAAWDKIFEGITTLDEICDSVLEEGEEPPPPGQMLANVAVAYSTQFFDDDGDLQFITTYLIKPETSTEAAVGLFDLAKSQIKAGAIDYG